MREICILGPQRLRPTLDAALRSLGWTGPFAVITAGWEEREAEVEELELHLGQSAINLNLFARGEEIFRTDSGFFDANQRYHDRRRELRELYNIRLSHGLNAVRELDRRTGNTSLLGPERTDAIAAIRRLDLNYLRRVRSLWAEFEHEWAPSDRPALKAHRKEIAAILKGAGAVLIAGGHVVNLLHSIRLFRLGSILRKKRIVAWSAGAMIIGERIVLFHDNPPQGAGNAEVCDFGLGLYSGIVPFPHARRRLRLDDKKRVSLLARRLAPALCVAMDDGAQLTWDGRLWRADEGSFQLTPQGTVEVMTDSTETS